MKFAPRVIEGGGSLLLPRLTAHGIAAWPKCLACRRNVDAYGIGEETPKYVEYWVRCDGIASPEGGAHIRSERAGIRIDKARWPGGWTRNSSAAVLARLALRPGKFAKWSLVVGDGNTVRPT